MNSVMIGFLIIVLAGLSSIVLTGMIRKYAYANSVMDIPNERSSHTVPTPRGGGVAIVITLLIAMPALVLFDYLSIRSMLAFWGAGALVALIGVIDDHGHIAPKWRLLAHFIAVIWALVCFGGFPALMVAGTEINLHWAAWLMASFYLVWLLNLYNFMDGIDGIAGIQAITVCLSAVLLYFISPVDRLEVVAVPLLLAVAVSGFLVWNFPKAKIFMGDAGSGFVGVLLGLLSVQAAWQSSELFLAWLILLAVFMVDATVTLLRRIVRGETFYHAHRSHVYQIMSRRWQSHVKVSIAVAIINVFWLLPLACTAVIWPGLAIVVVLIAYLPLVVVAFMLGAGASNE